MSAASARSPGGARQLLAAELALGVLAPEAQAEAEARAASDPGFAAEAAAWTARLHPLSEEVAPVTPPERLWTRIEAALGEAPASAAAPTVLTPSPTQELAPKAQVRRWRLAAAGAAIAALALFAALATQVGRKVVQGPLLAARLTPPADAPLLTSDPLYTATVDRAHASAVVTPVNPGPTDPRPRQLWAVAPGAEPIALGRVDRAKPVSLTLPRAVVAAMREGVTLSVSLEAEGGGGAAKGPVIASGVLAPL